MDSTTGNVVGICSFGDDTAAHSYAVYSQVVALAQLGQFREAATAYSRACELLPQTGDRNLEGRAWSNLGGALAQVGRVVEVRTCGEHAVNAFTKVGDTERVAVARRWLDALPPIAG